MNNKFKFISFSRGKFTLMLLILLIAPLFLMAQENKIKLTGKVVDENEIPLPGASVLEEGTTNGVTTDFDGNFEISVNNIKSVLVVNYLGYFTKRIPADTQTFFVKLMPDLTSLEEVVVIGYGQVKAKDLTGSISSVNVDKLVAQPVANVGDAIQGRAAGVQVVTSGKPGDNPSFRIRGTGTIGNNEPLIVVDGMPLNGGLNQVNMNDIASLQVLKDASSTAIYGSRGANGVIIISTKKGKDGKATVSFDTYTGFSEATNMLKVLNASEFAQLHNEILSNGGMTPNPDFANPESLGNGTDWIDPFFNSAMTNSHTLSYSNGSEKSTVYTSLNIFDQEGIVLNTDYKRYIFQLNTDTKISDKLKFGNNLKFNHDKKSQGDYNIRNTILSLPTQPIYRENGNYSGPLGQPIYSGDVVNPIGKATIVDDDTKGYNIQGTVFGELTFLKDFTFKTLIGIEANFWKNRTWAPSYNWDSHVQQNAFLSESSNQSITLLWDNTLTYQKRFENGINFNALIGTSAQENDFEYIRGSIQNFPSEQTQTLNNGVDQVTLDGSGSEWALFSYFARANFDYKSKYYVTATIRRDGSSRFGKNNKYGTFPSGSLAWRISDEDFFKLKFVNDLKIRAGYGVTGNQEIGNYSFASSYSTNVYNFNGNFVSAAVPTVMPNSNVKWESQEQMNIGFDASLINDRVKLVVDAYIKNTKDMLVPQSVPVTSGYSDIYVPYINAGEIQNKGFEIMVNSKNIAKENFSWDTDFVFSYNKNEVIDINGDTPLIRGGIGLNYNLARIQKGYPTDVFYGFVQDGIFQTQAEVDNHAVQVPGTSPSNSTSPGDIRYKDLNSDGLITDADRTFIGDPNPDFTFSLNNTLAVGDFSLNVYLQGVYGNEIFNANRIFTEGMAITTNQIDAALERWTGPGTSNYVPRAVFGDPNNNSRASSRYIEDGSYLRVKNVTLTYNIPKEFFAAKLFDYSRIYVSGQNLWTLTNYTGLDPEVSIGGIDNNLYPSTKTISIGLNLGF